MWLVEGFHDFAVELAIARRQLESMILANANALPSIEQRRHAYATYTKLASSANTLGLTDVCVALDAVCDLVDPSRIHPSAAGVYGRRVFAVGSQLDHVTGDVAMAVSRSSEWAPSRPVDSNNMESAGELLLDNGARAAIDVAQRLGRVVRVRVDRSPVSIPSLLLPVFHRMALQLMRNAVVHGIEDSIGRRAAGKPATAVINMAFRTEGAAAVLHVKDDGRGIDTKRAEVPESHGPTQLWHAIAAPGFSTAGHDIRSYAGRGIGLTRIQNTLERLGGHGEARTWAGHGTHIRLCLPTES
ncbi:MAG: hypothetical protein ACJAZO_002533 [Myxococcota bacterium]|jgi:hypothetical protein